MCSFLKTLCSFVHFFNSWSQLLTLMTPPSLCIFYPILPCTHWEVPVTQLSARVPIFFFVYLYPAQNRNHFFGLLFSTCTSCTKKLMQHILTKWANLDSSVVALFATTNKGDTWKVFQNKQGSGPAKEGNLSLQSCPEQLHVKWQIQHQLCWSIVPFAMAPNFLQEFFHTLFHF